MINNKIKSSELVISESGAVYHLNLKPDEITSNIFLVGDPARAYQVAKYFDHGASFERQNREFVTLGGAYRGLPVTVIGTGIGTDNIEIVAVELHILNEYNFKKGTWKKKYKSLNIIRLGTSGSPQKDIPVGSLAISQYAIGLDNTGIHYPYQSRDKTVQELEKIVAKKLYADMLRPYVVKADAAVVKALVKGCVHLGLRPEKDFFRGITSTASGFFGPQGRKIGRLSDILIPDLQTILSEIETNDVRVVNNEMESSAIFRILGERLGYRAGTICAVLANRNLGEFVAPEVYAESVEHCIRAGLKAMLELNK